VAHKKAPRLLKKENSKAQAALKGIEDLLQQSLLFGSKFR